MPRHMLSALAFAGLAIGAFPALAAPNYQAAPAVAPSSSKLVLRDVVWNCGDSGCAGTGASNSRPAIVCAVLAKEVGLIRGFSVAGAALSETELAQCNARVAKRIAKRASASGARVASTD